MSSASLQMLLSAAEAHRLPLLRFARQPTPSDVPEKGWGFADGEPGLWLARLTTQRASQRSRASRSCHPVGNSRQAGNPCDLCRGASQVTRTAAVVRLAPWKRSLQLSA